MIYCSYLQEEACVMRFWRPEGCSELIYLTHAACQSFVDPFHLSSFDFPFSFAVVFPVPFVPRTSLSYLFSEKILLISRYHRTQCTFVSLAQIIMSSRIPTKQPFTAALFQHQGIIIIAGSATHVSLSSGPLPSSSHLRGAPE